MEDRGGNDGAEYSAEVVHRTATTPERVMALLALIALLASAAFGSCRILHGSGAPAPVTRQITAVEGDLQLPVVATSVPSSTGLPRRISPAAS
jgi:hypothetical protein